ncbi:unnamed protein product [Gulo gulo]|uniref:Uncharacterized protein n=1 Tax=Gulo gulo TaxID=48420 RepID=A0A9X9PZD2_GULGU|nr:unnamed protein product [Gulo gulo]
MGSLGGGTQESSGTKALGQASTTVWMVSRAGKGWGRKGLEDWSGQGSRKEEGW